MTARNRIRFACNNCMQPLEARWSQAGSPMRCPWCNASLTVPHKSHEDRKLEQYGLQKGGQGTASGGESVRGDYIPVVCGMCRTRMYATPEQVGQKLICPDCGTPTIVPPRVPSPFGRGQGEGSPPPPPVIAESRAWSVPPPPPPPVPDIYNIRAGTDQPPPTDKVAYGRQIPVICGVCHTRMLATEDQVGQEIVCPDCGTPTIVPPPVTSPSGRGQGVGTVPSPAPCPPSPATYGLGGMDQPAPGSAAVRAQFAYRCPVCSTRLLAFPEEAGQQMQCPDCGKTFAIPEAPAKIRASGLEEGVDPYRTVGKPVVAPPVQVTGFAPVVGNEPLRPLTEEEMELRGERFVKKREIAPLPRWPFVRGVFTFPFYRECWPRWVAYSLGGTVCAGLGLCSAPLLSSGDSSTGGQMWIVFAGITAAIALALGILWAARMSNTCLAIVVETAGGFDHIEDWHSGEWIERSTEFFYLVSSYAWAAVIGAGVDWGTTAAGAPRGVGILASLLVLSPITLLSMLEAGTWLNPFSLPLWGSLFWGCWAWMRFYFTVALLDAAVVGVSIGLGYAIGNYAILLSGALLVAWCMIYFRLLGRLALCCADRIARQRREEQ